MIATTVLIKLVGKKLSTHLPFLIYAFSKKLCIPFPSSSISDTILKNASELLRFNAIKNMHKKYLEKSTVVRKSFFSRLFSIFSQNLPDPVATNHGPLTKLLQFHYSPCLLPLSVEYLEFEKE